MTIIFETYSSPRPREMLFEGGAINDGALAARAMAHTRMIERDERLVVHRPRWRRTIGICPFGIMQGPYAAHPDDLECHDGRGRRRTPLIFNHF